MNAATYSTLATKLQFRLSTVADIGIVHTEQRDIRDEESLRASFLDREQKTLAGFTMERESFTDKQLTNIENEKHSIFVFRGYRAHNDTLKTGVKFQTILDLISSRFRPQDNLDGYVEMIYPIQCRACGFVQFGNILCHYCELTLEVQERYNTLLP